MRSHPPKTAALAAYQAGALSPPRAAQVEAHVAQCAVCRNELAAIRLWSRESARMRAVKDVPVDFQKMELALAREAKAEAHKASVDRGRQRALPMVMALGVAAAVLLTIGFDRMIGGGPTRPSAPVAATSAGRSSAVPSSAVRSSAAQVEVALIAGEASVRGEGPPALGSRLPEGAVLDTRVGELHLAALRDDAPAASIALRADSTLVLLDGPRDAADAELVAGSMSVVSTSRVVVLAARYRIAADVATFDVWLSEDGIVVEVVEGSVRVTGLGEDTELVAPARFAPPAATSREVSSAVSRAVASRSPGAVNVRIERPLSVRWELETLGTIDGDGELAFEMLPGPLHLLSFDALGQAFPLDVVVGPEGLVVAGEDLTPARPTVRGFLDPAEINGVVRTSLPSLQRCYEHALRMRPEIGGGALRLRVSLDASGRVVRTRVEGGDVPETLQACATAEAERWSFPSPGGPVSFDLPLRFRSR